MSEHDYTAPVPLNPERMARLKTMHTRKLLTLLHGTYARGDYWEAFEALNYNEPTREEIKAVLRTREHIPNKKEREKIRKDKIKQRDSRNNRCVKRRK
jgi:hypothetical protein